MIIKYPFKFQIFRFMKFIKFFFSEEKYFINCFFSIFLTWGKRKYLIFLN